MVLRVFFLLLCTAIISCQPPEEEPESMDTDFLVNCWTHAQEEDRDRTNVYRLCDSQDFPASRFRRILDIKGDGSCEYLALSPVDAHSMEEGSWNFDQDSNLLEILDSRSNVVIAAEVTKLEADIMEIEMR